MMKLLHTTLAAGLLAVAAQAQAYSVDQGATNFTGTATVSVTGYCGSKKQTFENAQYGTVMDGEDEIGTGIVSSEGQLLALVESSIFASGITTSKKMEQKTFIDMASEPLANVIAQAVAPEKGENCFFAWLISDKKSRATTTYSAEGAKLSVNYEFDSIAYPEYKETNGAAIYKQRLSAGKVTFKGEGASGPI